MCTEAMERNDNNKIRCYIPNTLKAFVFMASALMP